MIVQYRDRSHPVFTDRNQVSLVQYTELPSQYEMNQTQDPLLYLTKPFGSRWVSVGTYRTLKPFVY